jgi:hypothetical protein
VDDGAAVDDDDGVHVGVGEAGGAGMRPSMTWLILIFLATPFARPKGGMVLWQKKQLIVFPWKNVSRVELARFTDPIPSATMLGSLGLRVFAFSQRVPMSL